MKHYIEYQRILANHANPDMRQLALNFDYLINLCYQDWVEDIHKEYDNEDIYQELVRS